MLNIGTTSLQAEHVKVWNKVGYHKRALSNSSYGH